MRLDSQKSRIQPIPPKAKKRKKKKKENRRVFANSLASKPGRLAAIVRWVGGKETLGNDSCDNGNVIRYSTTQDREVQSKVTCTFPLLLSLSRCDRSTTSTNLGGKTRDIQRDEESAVSAEKPNSCSELVECIHHHDSQTRGKIETREDWKIATGSQGVGRAAHGKFGLGPSRREV